MSDEVRRKIQKLQEQIEDEKDYHDAVQAKKENSKTYSEKEVMRELNMHN